MQLLAARVARPAPRDPRADGLPSLGADAEALIVELVKPMLFVCKVPMVNGTIPGIIVFGAIVSVSTMLSSSVPSLSSTASAAAYLPAGAPRFTDEEKRQFPRRGLSIRAACCPSYCSVSVLRALARCLVTRP